jgi:phosphoribosyl 1,2-cyclic phosphodiesterase
MKYGGNTTCVEIRKRNRKGVTVPLIIDAGTGIIGAGDALAEAIRDGGCVNSISLLFTHFHSDHIEGFKFFAPAFLPSCALHLMGMDADGKNIASVLTEQMKNPVFPIAFRDLKAVLHTRTLYDGQTVYLSQDGRPLDQADDPLLVIGVMRVYAASHPKDGALYYRITDPGDGTSVVCAWDIESAKDGDPRLIAFASGADALIHDTQYTREEYESALNPVQGYGHSTYDMALENAERARVKALIAAHYNPHHDDAFLDSINKTYTGRLKTAAFIMAKEGRSYTISKTGVQK